MKLSPSAKGIMESLNVRVALILLVLLFYAAKAFAASSPNVIIVITDDQGYGDLGFTGNPHIKTPSLDAFAGEAVRFTDFHVSTTCAPTRGALLTGRHTNRLNVFHTISGRSILWEDEVLLPQVLAMNGYTCGMFGKWHLGDNFPYRPEDRGFHEVVRHAGGGVGQMPDYWGNDYFDDNYWHNGQLERYEGYCTDVFFGEALDFIERCGDSPFFCYLSANAPHGPYNVPEEYLDIYAGNEQLSEREQRFYGMITNIDDNFRLLERKLSELGIRENTLLIYMTDNGTAAGGRVFNAGMRGTKGSEYEGGHRVPFMLRWPGGGLGGGRDIPVLSAHYDVLPTLVDLLNLKYNPLKPLDGVSLRPLLDGRIEEWPDRILYMDTQRLQNLVKYRRYSVMSQDWRLVNGTELYYLPDDPGESNNLIAAYPDKAARLAEGYEYWWNSIISGGVNERYAYVQAGTPHENPLRLCAHDLLTGKLGWAWHQRGACEAVPGSGTWKVEICSTGRYAIRLMRFPPESGLPINALFPAAEKPRRLESALPASEFAGFSEAYLFLADFREQLAIPENAREMRFEMELQAGKYDMEALLLDEHGRSYPAYYVLIEKL